MENCLYHQLISATSIANSIFGDEGIWEENVSPQQSLGHGFAVPIQYIFLFRFDFNFSDHI